MINKICSKGTIRIRFLIWSIGVAILFSGCGDIGSSQNKRRAELLVQRAKGRSDSGEVDKAIELYEKALTVDPAFALAHFDIAVLLQDHALDYVGSIYHYRRFLELYPETDKKGMIEDRIRIALQSLAGRVSGKSQPGKSLLDLEIVEEYGALREENLRLKARISELEHRLEQISGRGKNTEDRLHSGSEKDKILLQKTNLKGRRLYRVKSGDSLARISMQMYGTRDKTDIIFEANKSSMKNPDSLYPGQVLVIPGD